MQRSISACSVSGARITAIGAGAPGSSANATTPPASQRARTFILTAIAARAAIVLCASISAIAAIATGASSAISLSSAGSLHARRAGGGELQVHGAHLPSRQRVEAPAESTRHHLQLARPARTRVEVLLAPAQTAGRRRHRRWGGRRRRGQADDQHVLAAWGHAALERARLGVDLIALKDLLV
jgi:hypothetical protein